MNMHDHAIQCVHDPVLVTLSYLIAVLGSYTALQLAIGIPAARSAGERWGAITAAAAAMGGGAIWAMHFIAMLACKMDMAISYDAPLTVLSALIAIASCMVGLAIAGGGVFTASKLALGGIFMGLGVAGMHYTGMQAMRMPATLHYNVELVLASIAIAVVASIAALWLAFHMRGVVQMIGSALVMGVAVCGMHYTGMYAASFEPNGVDAATATQNGLSGANLGTTVFVVAAVLLVSVLTINVVRQRRRAMVQI